MLVKNVQDVIGTRDEVRTDTWVSRRVLLKKDGMGFPFMKPLFSWHRNAHPLPESPGSGVVHRGDGEIETVADGKKYDLGPGVVYALDQHDEHYLRGGKEPLRVICVFNPPLTGQEVHDEKGVYPAIVED